MVIAGLTLLMKRGCDVSVCEDENGIKSKIQFQLRTSGHDRIKVNACKLSVGIRICQYVFFML